MRSNDRALWINLDTRRRRGFPINCGSIII